MFGVFKEQGQNNPRKEVIDRKQCGRAGWGALEAGCVAESGAPSGGLTAG